MPDSTYRINFFNLIIVQVKENQIMRVNLVFKKKCVDSLEGTVFLLFERGNLSKFSAVEIESSTSITPLASLEGLVTLRNYFMIIFYSIYEGTLRRN